MSDEQWWTDFADDINDPELDMRIAAAEDGTALSDEQEEALRRFRAGEPITARPPVSEGNTNE